MKRLYASFVFWFALGWVFAQPIDYQQLNTLILQKVNEVRETNDLQPLAEYAPLTNAAQHHARYMARKKKTSSRENRDKFRTPEDRLRYYHATNEIFTENTLYVKVSSEDANLDSIASEIVEKWMKTPGRFRHMVDEDYFTTGVGTAYSKSKKRIYVVQLLGSKPFEESTIPFSEDNYGITRMVDDTPAVLDTMPEYYHESILVDEETGEVYYFFSDKAYFEENIPRKFRYSADIVFRSQFPCGGQNILHPSVAYDGFFTEPVKKKDLLKHNISVDSLEIVAPIGRIPNHLLAQDYEANMVVTRKHEVLQYITFSPLSSYDLDIMPIDLYRDTVYLRKLKETNTRKVTFTVTYEQGKTDLHEEDILPFYRQLNLEKYNIHAARIIGLSSVEGSLESNTELHRQRARNIVEILEKRQLDTIATRIIAQENWREFYHSIRRTPLRFLKDSSQAFIKKYLYDNYAPEIENLLKNHRKSIVSLKISEKTPPVPLWNLPDSISAYAQDSATLYKALYYQTVLHDSILNDPRQSYLLYKVIIPDTAYAVHLMNNRMVLREQLNEQPWTVAQLLHLISFAENEPLIQFNAYGLLVKRWHEDPYAIENVAQLEANIQKFRKHPQIPEGKWNKLLVNFHIAAAYFYMQHKLYKEERRSVGIVTSRYKQADLTQDDALVLANYFVFHSMFKRAQYLLKGYLDAPDLKEDVLYYFLGIAIYDHDYSQSEAYTNAMIRAAEMNSERFCSLFGLQYTFQLLRRDNLKALFCTRCDNF